MLILNEDLEFAIIVLPALDAGIHVFTFSILLKTWMDGSKARP